MSSTAIRTGGVHSALLCVETPLDAAGSPTALPRLYGNPVIFHQIKLLERCGIQEIAIAVDSVPAELPELVERVAGANLQVRIIRSGEVPAHEGLLTGDFLLVAPGIWMGAELIAEALSWPKNSIAILAESAGSERFERIDLNRRWSGFAVLDPSAIGHCAKMPEGWSIASFLLRHALQSGAREELLDQALLTNGKLRNISDGANVADIASQLASESPQDGFLEKIILKGSRSLVPSIAGLPWLSATIAWSPLVFALASALTAYLRYSSAALALVVLSLVLGVIRTKMQDVEYRSCKPDYPRFASYSAIFVTLWLVIFNNGAEPIDATFIGLLLLGALLLGRGSSNALVRDAISPLNLGFVLVAIWVALPFLTTVKLTILAMFGALIWANWRDKRIQSKLKPN